LNKGREKPKLRPPTTQTVQDLLGHANVDTTMIYLHVMKCSAAGGPSPLDFG
jgi:integrase